MEEFLTNSIFAQKLNRNGAREGKVNMGTKEISVININRIRSGKRTAGKMMPEIEIIIVSAYGYCFLMLHRRATLQVCILFWIKSA